MESELKMLDKQTALRDRVDNILGVRMGKNKNVDAFRSSPS